MFSNFFTGVILCSISVSIQLFVDGSVEFYFFDTIISAVIFFLSTIGTAILIPICVVWHDTVFGHKVKQNIHGTKVLLGMSDKSKQQPNE